MPKRPGPPFPPGSNGSSNGSSGIPPGSLQVSADQPPDPVLGYNLTGFMDTNAYYGSYGNVQTDTNAVPEPNVDASLVPPGCHVFNRWAIANYTGPLPCQTNGQPSSPSGPPCLIRFVERHHHFGSLKKMKIASNRVLSDPSWWHRPRGYGSAGGRGRDRDRDFAVSVAVPTAANWQLYQLDQTSDDSVKQLINRIASNYSEIDFLYLNAGRLFIRDIVNSDLRQFQLTFDTNFWGPVRVLQATLRLMPTTAPVTCGPYTVSKWGLHALQKTWVSSGAAPGSTPSNIDVIAIMLGTVNTSLGYNAIRRFATAVVVKQQGTGTASCPQLADAVGGQVIEYFKSQGLNPRDVGEAVYRIAIDPAPRPQYLIMRDDQWPTIIPLLCRRETLPLDQVYVHTPAGPNISAWLSKEAAARSQYTCSAACGGAPYCGPGPLGSGTLGTGTIGPY
ncbi:hypothetical protein KFL_006950030 [Klebsormidium nitens]|uniref:Uncharacterized protein n=1 Tax=Klebsormidium nitens TaxID=105231 RepID=A0A1Y1IRV7_KLENI|nr:hypothetical protein KFL_006950030 [Klebsormidium nitens]|eukprot:GAQ90868.1 hypothetical protein KFL_006950030 [Klebsormidium nitens]